MSNLKNEMLHVVMFVINNFTNDARVHREASTLAYNGYKVTVIALKDSQTPDEEVIDNYTVKRINVCTRSLPGLPGFQILKYLEFVIRAIFLAFSMRPNICHGHDLNALVPAYVVARLLKAYLIYDSHELASQRNIPRGRLWGEMKIWYYLEKWLIKKAHLVITVSPAIAVELARIYDVVEPQVIMNCPPYEDIPRNNILREYLGIGNLDIIVIYQGVFAPNRGLEVLVQSLQYLPEIYKLVLLGPDNSFKDSLKNQAEKLNLSERVFFYPGVPVNEVVKYVASADVGTFLSNPEIKSHLLGLPNKLFECMAAGTPIVVGKICRELVLQLGVGVTCDQNDPVSLANAVTKLTSNQDFYSRAQKNAREYAQKEYNWQVQGEKLCTLYSKLLKHHSCYADIS